LADLSFTITKTMLATMRHFPPPNTIVFHLSETRPTLKAFQSLSGPTLLLPRLLKNYSSSSSRCFYPTFTEGIWLIISHSPNLSITNNTHLLCIKPPYYSLLPLLLI
jgi:hypothetical protein